MAINNNRKDDYAERYKDLPALPIRPIENTSTNIENEEWRLVISAYAIDVEDNRYKVSSFGRVFDMFTNTLVPQISDGRGYLCVILSAPGRPNNIIIIKVHRLLMLHFKFRPDCYLLEIDHKNGKKIDNVIWNLEWVTVKENKRRSRFNGTSKSHLHLLSDTEAYLLFVDIYNYNFGMSKFSSIDEILNKYNVTDLYAEYIFTGKIMPHITYFFYNNFRQIL